MSHALVHQILKEDTQYLLPLMENIDKSMNQDSSTVFPIVIINKLKLIIIN